VVSIPIQPSDNEALIRATYGAGSAGFTPAATPTLAWLMRGSATKLVRIKSLTFSAAGSAAGLMGAALKRYSTAAAAGAFVAASALPHDPADAPSGVAVGHYTANPTPGTVVGTIHAGRLGFATGGQIDRLTWQWTWLNDKALVLNGATDWIGLDLLGGAVPAGGVIDWDVEWTEETDARRLTPAI
jgi:hypothetical protein